MYDATRISILILCLSEEDVWLYQKRPVKIVYKSCVRRKLLYFTKTRNGIK